MFKYLFIIVALIGLSYVSVEKYYDSKVVALLKMATSAEMDGNHPDAESHLVRIESEFGRNCMSNLISHIHDPLAPVLEKKLSQKVLRRLSSSYSRGTYNSGATVELLTAIEKNFDIDFELMDFVTAVKTAEGDDPYNRVAAAKALGFLKKKDGVRTLAVLLEDPYWKVRVEALKALVSIDDTSLNNTVLSMIEDPVSEVQSEAAYTSVILSHGNYSDTLFSSLDRLAQIDFKAAARAYSYMNTPRALTILESRLSSADPAIAIFAGAALARLRSEKGVTFLTELFNRSQSSVRVLLIESIRGIDHPSLIKLLTIGANEKETAVKIAAVQTLGFVKSNQAFRVLKAALTDSEKEVKVAAIRALGQTNMIQAADLVGPFLKETDQDLVSAAISASVLLRDERAVPFMEDLLRHSEVRANRLAAWNGLKKLTGKSYSLE